MNTTPMNTTPINTAPINTAPTHTRSGLHDDVATGCDLIVDGRTARRNRNRERVLDALIALAADGHDDPSVDEIAARAGVSYRSVYRYFDDRTDLMLHAIGRIMGDSRGIFDIEDHGHGTLDERIERFTRSRIAAYHQLAPLTRLAIRRSATEPSVAADYDRVRALLREQLVVQFAEEFDAMPSAERAVTIATLNVVFQFEAFEFLAIHDGSTDRMLSEVLERQLRAHLVGPASIAAV